MSDKYKAFRKHSVEIFNLIEKTYDDMVEYDKRLIVYTPIGSALAGLLIDDKDRAEIAAVFDKFCAEKKPELKQKINELLEDDV